MNNERLIADMYHPADTVTCVKRCTGTRIVFHSAMIVTMFNVLKLKDEEKLVLKRKVFNIGTQIWLKTFWELFYCSMTHIRLEGPCQELMQQSIYNQYYFNAQCYGIA